MEFVTVVLTEEYCVFGLCGIPISGYEHGNHFWSIRNLVSSNL